MATELTIQETDNSANPLVERFDSLVTHGEGGAIHNYDGSPEQMFVFTSKCTGSEVLPGGDYIDEVIDLSYWYVYPVQFEDGMGEVKAGIRTVLVTADNRVFGFGSTGIASSLLRALQAYGPGPWLDPISLRITQTTTKRGHRFFRLEPANMDLDG